MHPPLPLMLTLEQAIDIQCACDFAAIGYDQMAARYPWEEPLRKLYYAYACRARKCSGLIRAFIADNPHWIRPGHNQGDPIDFDK